MAVEQLKHIFNFRYKVFSEIGKRRTNEDRLIVVEKSGNILLALADGMGGYSMGEKAAETITYVLHDAFIKSTKTIEQGIDELFTFANSEIRHNFPDAGTTIAGATISETTLKVFWAGDVRVYLLFDNGDCFVSKDHSLLESIRSSKTLVSTNHLSRIKNVVTRSVGGNSHAFLPEHREFKTQPLFGLICSDGTHELFSNQEIIDILAHRDIDIIEARLHSRCVENSSDNSTAIIFSL